MNKISPRRWRWLAAPLAACLTAACTSAAATGSPAGSGSAAGSVAVARSASGSGPAAPLNCAPPNVKLIPCFSPHAYEVAYGVAPLLSRGIDGHGETVAVPELAQAPEPRGGPTDIRQDLATFDRKFGLPPARLQVVNTIARSKTPYLAGDEEIEDTEMVHAMAPGATLDVILVPADAVRSNGDFADAVTKVVQAGLARHVSVISISASDGEHFLTRAEAARMHAALVQASQQHVTVVASSGDNGAISDDGPPVQVSLPASDPLVLAVGGTILGAASPGGAYHGEMAWNGGTDGSAGGYSSLYPRPSYQDGVLRSGAPQAGTPVAGNGRGVPDVAASADHASGMALAFSDGSLRSAVGTSASTPLWAGVIALADQAAGHPLGFVNPALYAIARGPAYHQAFHDVVTGDNSVVWPTGVFTGYNAGPGWDPVTGWGSPDARYLVPLLARGAALARTEAGAEPACRGRARAGFAGQLVAKVTQGPGEQPGDAHLGDAQALAYLGLGQVPAEPQVQDLLLASGQFVVGGGAAAFLGQLPADRAHLQQQFLQRAADVDLPPLAPEVQVLPEITGTFPAPARISAKQPG